MSVTCQSDGLPKSIVVDHDQEFEDKARYVDVGNSVAVTQPQSSAYLPHSQSSGDVKTVRSILKGSDMQSRSALLAVDLHGALNSTVNSGIFGVLASQTRLAI